MSTGSHEQYRPVIEPMTFNIGTSIKHMWRAGLKPGMDHIDDLRKAREYLDFEIARLRRAQIKPPRHDEEPSF